MPTTHTSDLACESSRLISGVSGSRTLSRTIGGVKITDIRIPDSGGRLRPGRYITLEGDPSGNALPALLQRALMQLLPPTGMILAAGLGNPDITRDSLGALTIRRLVPRKGSRYSLAAVETDVAARTGIETLSLVRAAAREINAACVIAADSLSCSSAARLCRTVQLSTAGITPGSGTTAPRRELSQRTVGVPVIALGVPTALCVEDLTHDPSHRGLLASPGDEDVQLRLWAYCISDAVNSVIR